jgi:hypothetical protein
MTHNRMQTIKILLEKLPVAQQLRNFLTFYGTWKFIIMFTRAPHQSLAWARWVQSITPCTSSLRWILILSPYIHLGLPSGLFSSGLPTKTLYAFFFVQMHAAWPAQPILLDLNVLIESNLLYSFMIEAFVMVVRSEVFKGNQLCQRDVTAALCNLYQQSMLFRQSTR